MKKNIGINVHVPKTKCDDKKCPFHGTVSLRGRTFLGILIKKDTHKSATVNWERMTYFKKYERYEKKRSTIRAHNPPCINAEIGDHVTIVECKPLSKTINFVIISKNESR